MLTLEQTKELADAISRITQQMDDEADSIATNLIGFDTIASSLRTAGRAYRDRNTLPDMNP